MHTGQTLSSSGSERRYSIAFNAGKMEMAATHGQIDDNEHDNDIIIWRSAKLVGSLYDDYDGHCLLSELHVRGVATFGV